MSSVIYNGVEIKDTMIENFSHEPEFDSTGVNFIGIRHKVSIRGIVHLNQAATLGLAVGPNLATGLAAARSQLCQPRRRLTVYHAGGVFLDVFPGATEDNQTPAPDLGKMDIDHGPKPSLEILSVNGSASARVRFTCSALVPNCPGGSTAAGYVSMRFWVADDIDCSDWTTTRVYQGQLRTMHKLEDPKAFRNVVMPPLQRGFQRKTIALHESSDGLHLDFTIVDKEVWAVPPKPLTSWEGEFTVSAPGMYSDPIGYLEFKLTVKAPKSVPKRDVASLAAKIIDSKMHFIDGRNSDALFADAMTFTEKVDDNSVTAYCRMRYMGSGDDAGAIQMDLMNLGLSEFGKPIDIPGYNKEEAELPTSTATLTGLFLSELQTSCNPKGMPQITDPRPDDEVPDEPESPTQIYTSEGDVDYYNNDYSSSHYEAPYTMYAITSELTVDEAIVRMPFGKTNSDYEGTVVHIPLTRATATREVRLEACRLNKWPELPARKPFFIDDNGIKNTLISWRPMPGGVMKSVDGVKGMHRCDFVAVYSLDRPPNEDEKVSVGKLPYHTTDNREGVNWRAIESAFFVEPKTLIG